MVETANRPRLLFGKTYEVRVELPDDDLPGGPLELPGWYRAVYFSAHAREMGWKWEIVDPRFKAEECNIIDWRLPAKKCGLQ